MQVITEFHGAPNHDGTSISISPPFSIPVCTKPFISINKIKGTFTFINSAFTPRKIVVTGKQGKLSC